jgi:hypothetical protein
MKSKISENMQLNLINCHLSIVTFASFYLKNVFTEECRIYENRISFFKREGRKWYLNRFTTHNFVCWSFGKMFHHRGYNLG